MTSNASDSPPAANGRPKTASRMGGPGRLRPLACLPVFLPLEGEPALVAGDGEGATWKAELLAAAGADVTLLAPEPCEEMIALAASEPTAGRFTLERRAWAPADLFGPRISVLETECAAEAAAFAALGRAAGTIVNTIDRPAHCDVRFGSIVNRSPVVVGISTDGAAPILGQAVRRRIEALLPAGLADWAAQMGAAHTRLMRAMPEETVLRRFFERFADLAFRERATPDAVEALAADVMADREPNAGGRVTLVGAGPGDAELLTLKAVRALQSADVILFDALVSDEVLELARREARRIPVGKRGGRASCRQEDINTLMVKLAREGHRVVRLKSGDPMVFGRAGEEIAAARAAGIPIDVVPGITSALALSAALGISLTHRDAARSVRFVTGHSHKGTLPDDLDWAGLADRATTLVFYMGAGQAGAISKRLRDEGLSPVTPTVVARGLGRPDQTIAVGDLAGLGEAARSLPSNAPVLIAIGRVFYGAVPMA